MEVRGLMRLLKVLVALSAAAGTLVFAASALGNAANPIAGTAKVDSVSVSGGAYTITVEGQWNWVTQTDCPTARDGVGYNVAWFDPSDTANPIGGKNSPNGTIDVGSATDNIVHSIYTNGGPSNTLVTSSNPFFDGVPSSYLTHNTSSTTPTKTDASNWVSNCNNENPTTKISSGQWGPIAHTYPAGDNGPFVFCPVMYDPHGSGTTSGGVLGSSGTGDLTAGGSGHNNDNSYEGNGTGTNGNNCQQLTIPTISTKAQASVTVGSTISDQATLNGSSPTGKITWNVYKSSDMSCSNPVNTQPSALTTTVSSGNGTYNSPTYTPAAPGSYQWVATYSGDSTNASVSTNCNDPNEVTVVNPGKPSISTSATTPVTLGASIQDTATVSGGQSPTGTVTFNLYSNSSCTAPAVYSDTETLSNGSATSGSFTPTSTGSYFWIATYNGDSNNSSVSGHCGDQGETSKVNPGTPSISTSATTSVTLGASIQDTATVSGGSSPSGTVTFNLYNNSSCTAPAVLTDTETLSGGAATSKSFTPSAAGTYFWIATYNGDSNNSSVSGHCGDAGETSKVNQPGSPTIVTSATTPVTIGASIQDTATVSGGNSPTGTVTFKLYNNSSCTAPAAFSDTETLSGGAATSKSFTPTTAGTYFWIATYNGDANNSSVSGNCGDNGETSKVNPGTPSIATSATTPVTIGSSVQDTATVSGGSSPTGTVTFNLYSGSSCNGAAVFTDTETLSGGSATSKSFTPTTAGSYFWIATYNGDTNNSAVSGHCGDNGETSKVNPATPSLMTSATSGVVGQSIQDTATLSGGDTPTGTITWKLYGPNDGACSSPIRTFTTDNGVVNGDGQYTSPSFTTTSTGNYHWVASYSGDTNNNPVAGSCGDPGETSTVTPQTPTLTTNAINGTVGSPIHDTATLTGGLNPTGTITWNVYNNDTDAGCTTPLNTSAFSATVTGDGTYTSPNFTPTTAGHYEWVATYSGDGNNVKLTSSCSDPNELSTVTNNPAPAITLVKSERVGTSGSFTHGPVTGNVGQTVNYQMLVTNTGNTNLVINFTDPQCDTGTLDSPSVISGVYDAGTQTLSAGGALQYTCSHVLAAGDQPYTNTANVVGTVPGTNQTVSAQDSVQAFANTPATPAITLVKLEKIGNAAFTHGPITGNVGDTVNYQMTVTNTGNTTLVIAFSDAQCDGGTLSAPSVVTGSYDSGTKTLSVGGELQYTCSHVLGANDRPYTNTASVTGTPPPGEGSPVSAQDSVQASVPTPGPAITLVKQERIGDAAFTHGPITGDVGQTVDYQMTVSNTGNVPLVLSFTDAQCDSGTLSAASLVSGTYDAATQTLSAGSVVRYTCSHVLATGDEPYTNTASVTGTPPPGDGSPVSAQDSVQASANVPGMRVVKLQRDGTSGAFTSNDITASVGDTIYYEIQTTNTGNVPLSLSLSDPNCDSGTVAGPISVSGTLNGNTLEPHSIAQYTCWHVVTAADLPAFTNVGTITGTPPSGPPVHGHGIVVAHITKAGIQVVKLESDATAGGAFTHGPITFQEIKGQPYVVNTIDYQIQVTNTGDVPLSLSIDDPHCDSGTLQGPSVLAGTLSGNILSPGGEAQYTCSHDTSASDPPAFFNTATVTGTPPSGPPVSGHSTVEVDRKTVVAKKICRTPSGKKIVYTGNKKPKACQAKPKKPKHPRGFTG